MHDLIAFMALTEISSGSPSPNPMMKKTIYFLIINNYNNFLRIYSTVIILIDLNNLLKLIYLLVDNPLIIMLLYSDKNFINLNIYEEIYL